MKLQQKLIFKKFREIISLLFSDKEQFQLFKSSHIFERYDLKYKKYFGFEKAEQVDLSYKMPLRFIWGIQPVDHGSYLNPGDRGKLFLAFQIKLINFVRLQRELISRKFQKIT